MSSSPYVAILFLLWYFSLLSVFVLSIPFYNILFLFWEGKSLF